MHDSDFTEMISPPLPRSEGVLGEGALGVGRVVGVAACGSGSEGVLGGRALGVGRVVGVAACETAGGGEDDKCRGGVLETIFGKLAGRGSQVASCRAGASWKHVFEVGGASQAVGTWHKVGAAGGGGSAKGRLGQEAWLAWGDGGVYVAGFVRLGFVWGVCRFLFLCFRSDGAAAG